MIDTFNKFQQWISWLSWWLKSWITSFFMLFSLKLISCIFIFQGLIDFTWTTSPRRYNRRNPRIGLVCQRAFCQRTSPPTEIRRYLKLSGTGLSVTPPTELSAPVCLSGFLDSHKAFLRSLPVKVHRWSFTGVEAKRTGGERKVLVKLKKKKTFRMPRRPLWQKTLTWQLTTAV